MAELAIAIKTEADYERAIERIHDLAGCVEDDAEEWELIETLLAVKIWESKRGRVDHAKPATGLQS